MNCPEYNIMNVPEDILFEIMKNFDYIEDLSSFCLVSKRHYSLYLDIQNNILKHYLKFFKVDYTDPTNFIYLANNIECKDVLYVDSKVNYKGIFKLYMEFYYDTGIRYVGNKGHNKITSFPIYPNMVCFIGHCNQLTNFYSQPKMTHFWGKYNQLTSFPIQPKMTHFHGNNNQLKSFDIQPELLEFYGHNNQLTSFPVQPKMIKFNGENN